MIKTAKKIIYAIMKFPVILLAPIWVKFMKFIAYTGIGTDYSLEHGILPMTGSAGSVSERVQRKRHLQKLYVAVTEHRYRGVTRCC